MARPSRSVSAIIGRLRSASYLKGTRGFPDVTQTVCVRDHCVRKNKGKTNLLRDFKSSVRQNGVGNGVTGSDH
ncbi:hypothetical protein ACVWZK_008602 [Bradyrhizobium sp. GM0.4]